MGDLMEAYEDRTGFDEAAFGARLRAWFTAHFRTEDARLHKNRRCCGEICVSGFVSLESADKVR